MPKTFPPRRLAGFLTFLGAVLAVALVGCEQPAPEPTPPAASRTPEERFESIVTALRRQVEDESITDSSVAAGFDAPPGTPIASGSVRVQSNLAPAAAGEPRRATISLVTNSKVTIVLPRAQTSEGQEQEASQPEGPEIPEGLSGFPDLESLRTPAQPSSANPLSGGAVHEIETDDSRRVYELEYRDDRWVLLTELDPENEPFYALAIEYALKKQ